MNPARLSSAGGRCGNSPPAIPSVMAATAALNAWSTSGVSGTAIRVPRSLRRNQYSADTAAAGMAEGGAGGVRVDRQLEFRAARRRIDLVDLPERAGAAGLVVDDHQRITGAVDPVGAATEAHLAAVGQQERHSGPALHPEDELGPDLNPPQSGPEPVVVIEQHLQIGAYPAELAAPEHRMPGHAPVFELQRCLGGDAAQFGSLRRRPPLAGPRHRRRSATAR